MRTDKLIRIIAFALVISLLTALISTAFAAYDTIPFGEQSDSVRKMQKALKAKKFYSGSIDGKFGPSTKKAVQKFQRSIGLKADGKPGNKTLTALYEGTTKVNEFRNVERKTTAENPRTLYYGCSGTRVKALQRALKEVGCYNGTIDGKYGDLTYEAVKRYQSKKGLTADGKAGPKTIASLNANTKKNNVRTSFVLEKGSSGREVDVIQTYLRGKGFYKGGDDAGFFGENTKKAVVAWQSANGMTQSGAISEAQYTNIVTSKK